MFKATAYSYGTINKTSRREGTIYFRVIRENRLSFDEDIYAARIGRNMWRLAKRRAREAGESTGLIAVPARRAPAESYDNKAQNPASRLDQARSAPGARPNTLSEFLQLLAAELAGDDRDPGGS